MIVAALLAITLDPALRLLFTHMKNFDFRPTWLCRLTNAVAVGTIHSEEKHPISGGALFACMSPWSTGPCAGSGRSSGGAWFWLFHDSGLFKHRLRIHAALGRRVHSLHALNHALVFPAQAQKLLQVTDRIIKQFPEVDRVLGRRAGRDFTDPAPISMLETVIILQPSRVASSANLVFLLGA